MRVTLDLDTFRSSKSRYVPSGSYVVRMIVSMENMYNIYPKTPISEISDFCKKGIGKSVLIIGSNPSVKSPTNEPFHKDTRSRKFVDNWFNDNKCWDVIYDNLIDKKIEGNKPLTTAELKEILPWIKENIGAYKSMGVKKIVACGKTASKGLTMASIEHFEMPHPSGLCRFWNDKEAADAKIQEMKDWILDA